jgi:HJR/Mrr/RecB family endonuclease
MLQKNDLNKVAKEKAKENLQELLPLIETIEKLIDICFDLVPESQKNIFKPKNKEKLSEDYVDSYKKWLLKAFVAREKIVIAYQECGFNDMSAKEKRLFKKNNPTYKAIQDLEYKLYSIANWSFKTSLKYYANTGLDGQPINTDFNRLSKFVYALIRQNKYTDPLLSIVLFLTSFDFRFKEWLLYEVGILIGKVLLQMGAIESALKLFEIDNDYFDSPNDLSVLASNAIRIKKLDSANEIVNLILIGEPFHPSIKILQAEIKALEHRYLFESLSSITISDLDSLSGIEFENLIADKFHVLGFKVESTPKTGDYGADLIVENKEGTRFIVQCKRFNSKVNLKAVQEVIGAMGHYAGDIGIVITNNTFLNSAIKLAESHDIELWNGQRLTSFLAGDLSFSENLTE